MPTVYPFVRKAVPDDLDPVMALYERAIEAMDAQGIAQWDEVYPNREVLQEDIRAKNLYLCMDGEAIAAVFALNGESDPEYAGGSWQYPDVPYLVLHRLCVDPNHQGRGVGTGAVLAAEAAACAAGAQALRLDAFSGNPAAQKMYERLCYTFAGQVRFRKGIFYLYEKHLQASVAGIE